MWEREWEKEIRDDNISVFLNTYLIAFYDMFGMSLNIKSNIIHDDFEFYILDIYYVICLYK